MKNTFLFLIIALTNNAICQTDIYTSFNSTYAGRNISFDMSKTKNINEYGVGLRVNINQIAHNDDQNKIHYKRLYATKPYHYFGAHFFYHRNILETWENIHPFLFFDFQGTYSTTRTRMMLPYMLAPDGITTLYKEHIVFFGPYTWLENSIGFGYKAKLFKNIYLTQKVGFSANILLGFDKQLLDRYFNWFGWEFGAIVNVGLIYRFDNKYPK